MCGGRGFGKCMDEGKGGAGWMCGGMEGWEVYGLRVAGWMCGGWGMYGEGGGGLDECVGGEMVGECKGEGGLDGWG